MIFNNLFVVNYGLKEGNKEVRLACRVGDWLHRLVGQFIVFAHFLLCVGDCHVSQFKIQG